MKGIDVKLTISAIRAARPAAKLYDLRDDEVKGLLCRIGTSGKKTFAWRGAVTHGPKITITLGTFGDITLDEARTLAREVRRLARSGIDPRLERQRQVYAAQANDERTALTFSAFVPTYLAAFRLRRTPTSRGRGTMSDATFETERHSLEHAAAILGDRPLDQIGRPDVLAVKAALPTKSASLQQKVFGAANRLMELAAEQQHIEANPFRLIRAPRAGTSRSRRLSPDEFRAVYGATFRMRERTGALHRFLMLVPLRAANAAGLTWSQIDGDLVRLDKTKSTGEWVVPMPPQAMDLLDALPRHSDLIFASSGRAGRNVGGVFKGWSKAKRQLDDLSGVTDWRLHDMRRTIVSACADRMPDYDESTAELWLQHTRPGIRSIYQVGSSLPGLRRLAAGWGEVLGEMLSNDADSRSA
jgi:integrase